MKRMSLKANHRRDAIIGWTFIAPQMAGFVIFVLLPLISVFIYSVQEKNLLFGTSMFTGLENFRRLFADPLFTNLALGWFP